MTNPNSFNLVFMNELVKLKKGEDCLNYKNGKEILPEKLLKEMVQQNGLLQKMMKRQ